jgi:hypothetical protein
MDPFAYETYRQQRIQKKLEEERSSRISVVRKLPKVNTLLAARLLAESAVAADKAAVAAKDAGAEPGDADAAAGGARGGKAGSKAAAAAANPLADSRFAALFEDPDFTIDEAADEYRALHPNAVKDKRAEQELLREHFQVRGRIMRPRHAWSPAGSAGSVRAHRAAAHWTGVRRGVYECAAVTCLILLGGCAGGAPGLGRRGQRGLEGRRGQPGRHGRAAHGGAVRARSRRARTGAELRALPGGTCLSEGGSGGGSGR